MHARSFGGRRVTRLSSSLSIHGAEGSAGCCTSSISTDALAAVERAFWWRMKSMQRLCTMRVIQGASGRALSYSSSFLIDFEDRLLSDVLTVKDGAGHPRAVAVQPRPHRLQRRDERHVSRLKPSRAFEFHSACLSYGSRRPRDTRSCNALHQRRAWVPALVGHPAYLAGAAVRIRQFAQEKDPVRALVRNAQKASKAGLDKLTGVEIVEGDMSNPKGLEAALDQADRVLMI
jgi:hypothetical protein